MSARRDRAAELVRVGVITAERACHGKTRYANQNDARHAAKLVGRNYERATDTYRCPFCRDYHMTKLRHGESAE